MSFVALSSSLSASEAHASVLRCGVCEVLDPGSPDATLLAAVERAAREGQLKRS
jgi:hypothetical protein